MGVIYLKIARLGKIFIIGLLSGIVNGLLGIGGGTILIPAMVFLLGEEQHKAHGTALMAMLPIALVSTFLYGLKGSLDYGLALKVASSGVFGGYLGAKLMNRIRADHLKKAFAIFLIIAGLRMVI